MRMSRIWWYALGYFLAYVPYSAYTKALTAGLHPKLERPLSGFELLPVTVAASAVGMLVFLTAMRWWKDAHHTSVLGIRVPHPTRVTFLSGLCTAAIIGTTTLAYTFEGVSIVFVMLLMRGGVLILAPIVDALTGRRSHWYSWVGLLLSLGGLLIAFAERGGYTITVLCAVDVAVYLLSYFLRLRFMTREAKTDEKASRRFFVEEQMVAAPAMLAFLALVVVFGSGPIAEDVRAGFTAIWGRPVLPAAIAVGLFSQATGIFGGLILLDSRENTYCVPVNRASSILAGVVGSMCLAFLLDVPIPSGHELLGAACVLGAIVVLAVPGIAHPRADA